MNIITSLIDTITSYYRTIKSILITPKLLGLCVAPWIVGIITWGILFITALWFKDSLSVLLYSDTADWMHALVEGALVPALFIGSAAVAVLVSLIVNEFTIDPFIIHLFHTLLTDRPDRIPARSLIKQTKDSLIRMIIVAPLSVICFLLGFIPIIGLPFLAVSFFIIGCAIADLPLCILDYTFKMRNQYMFRNWDQMLWLGGIFSISFLIPGLSLLLLPLGYGAAVHLISKSDFGN